MHHLKLVNVCRCNLDPNCWVFIGVKFKQFACCFYGRAPSACFSVFYCCCSFLFLMPSTQLHSTQVERKITVDASLWTSADG